MHYLYAITNRINGRVYIGQTIKPQERWRQHCYYAETVPVQYIQASMREHGAAHFSFEVIACAIHQTDADALEVALIEQYDSRNIECGYNLAPGGNTSPAATDEFSAFMKAWHADPANAEFKTRRAAAISKWHESRPDVALKLAEGGKATRFQKGQPAWNRKRP